MIIQDIIGDRVSELEIEGSSPVVSPLYYHGPQEWQNLFSDEALGDMVILSEPVTSEDQYKQGGLLEETYPLRVVFLGKSELDYTPEQHKPIIARMRRLRFSFINKLSIAKDSSGRNLFREIKNIRTIDVVNMFDSNRSGVILSITVVPFNQLSRC